MPETSPGGNTTGCMPGHRRDDMSVAAEFPQETTGTLAAGDLGFKAVSKPAVAKVANVVSDPLESEAVP